MVLNKDGKLIRLMLLDWLLIDFIIEHTIKSVSNLFVKWNKDAGLISQRGVSGWQIYIVAE